MSAVRISHPSIVLFGDNSALVCDLSGSIAAEEVQGFFVADTRMISTYKVDLNGCAWRLLGRSRLGHGGAQWQFQNPMIRDALGDIAKGSLSFGLRRRVAGALHDDLLIQSFAGRPVRLRLVLQLDADFADIMEVKSRSMPPRMDLRRVFRPNGITLVHEVRGFRRALHVRLQCSGDGPSSSGSRLSFDIALKHGEQWQCCIDAVPEIDDGEVRFGGDPHEDEPDPRTASAHVTIECASILAKPFARGSADLRALAVRNSSDPVPYVAAGAPWFLALFGRDSLVAALMAGLDGAWLAEGSLAALGRRQGRRRDDFRDEEPGKIAHELRRDELTHLGELPYSPYYGTHDAPSLYCLALWHGWRWTGRRELVETHFDTARRALCWCDELGDRDGDGLQEYETRSRKGYRNQGWKDAGDAVVDAKGRQPRTPIATVELQGYLFAARIAMAELADELGCQQEARRYRVQAAELRRAVEERFWLDDEGFYAFGLDRDKHAIDAIASNAGHLLWCGLPDSNRARRVATRLLEPDMFSGWGLRSLSDRNPAYNPLSYQLGSVWPHDTLIAAAGLWRYELRDEAAVLIRAVLQASEAFEDDRLPELFAGLDASCGFPVPYEEANIPQAWAAAVPLLAAQLFLGIVPDAPRCRCFVSPWLPEWLPRLAVRGISVADKNVTIAVARKGDDTVIENAQAEGIDIVHKQIDAPLWGTPPAHTY
jgi:glycogen debranching enzyme